jgi:hypothetical protein
MHTAPKFPRTISTTELICWTSFIGIVFVAPAIAALWTVVSLPTTLN